MSRVQSAQYIPGPTTGRVDRLLLGAGATSAGPTFVVVSLFAGACLAVGVAIAAVDAMRGRR